MTFFAWALNQKLKKKADLLDLSFFVRYRHSLQLITERVVIKLCESQYFPCQVDFLLLILLNPRVVSAYKVNNLVVVLLQPLLVEFERWGL